MKPIIAPSVLAADLANIEAEVKDVVSSGADWLHIDVMDGTFVPPITFGDNMVKSISNITETFLDVHLMIERPEEHIANFSSAGANRIIVHQECSPHLHRTLSAIREHGVKNGVAINPGTAVETVFPSLHSCDLVLVMTVNPGWGGQSFIEACLDKVSAVKREISKLKLPTLIEVDGGINADTGRRCLEAGADVLVAGTYVFGAEDRGARIAALKALR